MVPATVFVFCNELYASPVRMLCVTHQLFRLLRMVTGIADTVGITKGRRAWGSSGFLNRAMSVSVHRTEYPCKEQSHG